MVGRLAGLVLACALLSTTPASAAREGVHARASALKRDLRVWLKTGGSSKLAAEERTGEQMVTLDNQQAEDDTNEKIIEALLVKQKRLEGENHALRKQLLTAHSHSDATLPASSQATAPSDNAHDHVALEAEEKQLVIERNQSSSLRGILAKKVAEVTCLKQSLDKAKKALLQSVDSDMSAGSEEQALQESKTQVTALKAQNTHLSAENTRIVKQLQDVDGRRQVLEVSVGQLQAALNQSLVAVSDAETQLDANSAAAKATAPAATTADVGSAKVAKAVQQQIAELQKENMKLKVAGHTLMERYDRLQKTTHS